MDDDEITGPQFVQPLKDLPIPVIGIPWYQMRFLPDILTVGHEVGHNVEEDFGLTGRIQELLDAALVKAAVPAERAEGWHAWLGELFADVYGILVGGPAFVSGLMDFLALSPKKIVSDRQPDPGWLDHPPNGLRVQFNLRPSRCSSSATPSPT